MDYYGKFQNNIQDAAKTFASKDVCDGDDDAIFASELSKRVEELEERVGALEKLLGRIFKQLYTRASSSEAGHKRLQSIET